MNHVTDTKWRLRGPTCENDHFAEVGAYYDELDEVYCSDENLHMHHGLWLRGDESRAEAKNNLVQWLAARLDIQPGQRCADIGCGYGETARLLANSMDISVDAITVSYAQYRRAIDCCKNALVQYHLGNWLDNAFPPRAFDIALAIESFEHFHDAQKFLSECRRVLKPRGKLIISTWLKGPNELPGIAKKFVLGPISYDFHLAPLRTVENVTAALNDAGFQDIAFWDLTNLVKRTWYPTASKLLRRSHVDSSVTSSMIDAKREGPGYSLRTLRIAFAYWSGLMRYGAFLARMPSV